MTNKLGITQWTVPWEPAELCAQVEVLGLSAVHIDLGSSAKGYPMTHQDIREKWLEKTAVHHLEIVSLALNDLCNHGFTAGLKDPQSEIAVKTMEYGVETACKMGIPAISVPHFFANRIRNEESNAATVEALRFLCDLAREAGILIYTENVLNLSGLNRLWQEVDRDNLRLLFDTQNYAAMGDVDAAEIFRHWKPYCGAYIHLKDGDGSLGNRCLWAGTSGFERIFAEVLSSDYEGTMILESNYENAETLRADLGALRARLNEQEDMI